MSTTAQPAMHLDVARGVLLEKSARNGATDIVFAVPNTDYRLHLVANGAINVETGQAIHGIIDVNAHRIDVCRTGGQYIDPVMGRPRNIQGRVRAIDAEKNAIIVQAKVPVRVHVRAPQKATDFNEGDLVTFFVDRGATLTPVDD